MNLKMSYSSFSPKVSQDNLFHCSVLYLNLYQVYLIRGNHHEKLVLIQKQTVLL
jgi:hypothetical protein